MRGFLRFLFVVFGVFALAASVLFYWNPPILSNDAFKQWELKANMGQAFGALSAALGASAFGAALYTVHLQQKQLDLQRKEIEESRDILLRTLQAQQRSVAALQQQASLIATSAKLNAVISRMETELKIKEIKINYAATYGSAAGVAPDEVLNFTHLSGHWAHIQQIENELKQLSETPAQDFRPTANG